MTNASVYLYISKSLTLQGHELIFAMGMGVKPAESLKIYMSVYVLEQKANNTNEGESLKYQWVRNIYIYIYVLGLLEAHPKRFWT